MVRPGFWSLYALCLVGCLGTVEGLRRAAPPSGATVELDLDQDFIAVPPKPHGARPAEPGEGTAARYTEASCRELEGDFRDACFHFLALQRAERDLLGAQQACAAISASGPRWECEADLGELHSKVDRPTAEALCTEIPPKKWRDQCHFGIAMAWSRQDPGYARDRCESAGMWRDFCRHDVNGEIAQVDPEGALAWCVTQSTRGTPLQRKTCFHGLGKYLGRTDPGRALGICQQVPETDPLYRENCFHGLGWAVAETDEDQALALCAGRAGSWRDSCRLGVSSHAKRLDAARALEICAGVERADLRRRCEDFARR